MVKSLFSFHKEYTTAVEIDKNYIKVSQAEAAGRNIFVSKLAVHPIYGFSNDEISKAFSKVISDNRISLNMLIAVMPRERAMVRYLHLPAVTDAEIESMITFEITKQVPYSHEEVVSDYRVLGSTIEGYSDIMLTVVHKNEIERLNDILKTAAKAPDQIMVSSEASAGYLKGTIPEEARGQDFCMIDIDTDATEIAIISDEKLVFNRVASIGAASISHENADHEPHERRLINQIERSIEMYSKDKAAAAAGGISRFFIIGADSVIEDFTAFLTAELDVNAQPVSIFSGLSVGKDILSKKDLYRDSSLCAVSGCLLVEDGINLVSKDLKKKRKAQLTIKSLSAVSILLLAGIFLLLAAMGVRMYQKEQLLAQMNNMLLELQPMTRETREKLNRLGLIKKQFSGGSGSLEVIYNVYQIVPDNVQLVDFDYEEKGRVVRIRGTASAMSDVFKLASLLEESDKFSNVQTRSVVKRRVRSNEIVDFQIRCKFTPPEAGL